MSDYSGDGHLIDNGWFAATDRYVLNLGPIDLTQQGSKSFRIANLPQANFVTGIEIRVAPEDRPIIERQRIGSIVSVELSGPGGNVLFAKQAPLDAWTWSVPAEELRAFVYGEGETGTYFNAVPGTAYKLTFNVIEPDRSRSKYSALLVSKSGGWK